jgi:adenylate kinase family enzyme
MQKILILGSCGAGKSTTAQSLSDKLSIPVHYLDLYSVGTDWHATSTEYFESMTTFIKQDTS